MTHEINLLLEWRAFRDQKYGTNISHKTKQIYSRAETILFNCLPEILHDLPALVVAETDIHKRVVKQLCGVAQRRYPNLSPTSVNIYVRVWNTFLNALYRDEVLDKQPKIEKLKEHTKLRKILSDEQILAVTSAKITPKHGLNLYRIHTMLLAALGTGARLNEVLKIQARDVISAQNLLNIYSGKGAKQRVVPMSALLAVRIHRFMSWRKVPKGNFIFGCKRNRNAAAKLKNPVLKHPYGKMSGSNVVRDLGLLCEHLKIRRFQFHALRHTFATKYLKNGGDLARLRKLMGHSSIQTTMIYEHLDNADIIENFTDYTPF